MKLFLASLADNPISLKKLEDFVGGFKGKKIVYIPTAANGETWESWKEGGSWSLVQTLGAQIELLVLEDYPFSTVGEKLRDADIIWFAGGQPGYLMYWIRRTQMEKDLRVELDRGAVYVGSSAGSMITGKTLDITEWYIGEQEHGAAAIPGLGFVDFDIYPHYQDELLDVIKKNYKGKELYLLKDGEAVIVDGDNTTVFGEERKI